MRFSGKTVIVTGSGSGIGAVTARRFAAEGANAVIADIDFSAAERVAASIPGSLALEVDVTSRKSLGAMVRAVDTRFGGTDVLINNAATCSDASFLQIAPEEVERDLAVGLMGPFFASQEIVPGMIERGGGVILNVGSVNGLSYFGNEAYSAAKAGLLSLTRSIAIQYGRNNIRCNAVAPGTVATEYWDHRRELDPLVFEKAAQWYPLGRIGEPADVADALLFLASDAAAWITGVVLPVDGGLLSGNLAMARAVAPERSEPSGDA
ncbi:SDR family NAD(P)-dependent oxidoreductase [Leifsonia bigeumensis]|uniref:SDR family NAD(P)-dependent oxidoreductase n=1 Tax=Leifsonella bigeumensis TaxID=433643 RepID=A0ABP7FB67_9MICO